MAALEQLVFLYLKACEVEGKTYRTVQFYDESLRQLGHISGAGETED